MSLPSLYTLRSEYEQLAHKLSECDLDAQTIQDTIESTGILDDFNTKAQSIVFVSQSFEAHDAAIKTEIARLTALSRHRQTIVARLKEYLLCNMLAAGITRIEGPLMKISIRDNPEAVDVFENALIPIEFMRFPEAPPPQPDKVAIKAALKAGADVPGCRLTRSQKLQVT